jgi:asparagine synthase (glutamine-hydrolysing)
MLSTTIGDPYIETERGLIVGPLFDRRFPGPVTELARREWQDILLTRGERLIGTFWGGYVAVLKGSDDTVDIVRAPFSELPCYWIERDGAVVLASDCGLLVDTGLLRPTLDWEAIIRELSWTDLRGGETCLTGVRALRGGERLSIEGGRAALGTLWNPWRFVEPVDDRPSAIADRIRRATQSCVQSRASPHRHVLLLLSGGLDSSIVAACLAGGRTPFSLATMTTRDALGDERNYGRCVAETVGQPLHEALREVLRIDPGKSTASRLPRPAGRMFEQETSRIAEEIGLRVGAQALLTGGGGDNVFCSLQSAAPAADRLLVSGPGRAFMETARETSRLAQASLPVVVRAAVGRIWPWARRSPVSANLTFLSKDAHAAIGAVPPHPWLAPPRGALPGKAAHVKLLALAESFQQGFDPEAALPMVTPLLGQPLVEACLAVPSWRWLEEGRNRAVARRAFAGDLPERIVWRRSKGTPDSFVAEIYERYRLDLRERVLGGLLAEQRVIDVPAARRAFDQTGSLVPVEYRRLLALADVENWARAWCDRASH